MILGLGNDLIDIRRIEKNIEKYGDRFLNYIYTKVEQEKCNRQHLKAPCYAKRFAAKEACAKALGTGIAKGVFWTDMSVVNLTSGKPTIELTGRTAELLQKSIPEGHEVQVDLSLTDDYPMAQAIVIISANKV